MLSLILLPNNTLDPAILMNRALALVNGFNEMENQLAILMDNGCAIGSNYRGSGICDHKYMLALLTLVSRKIIR